MVVQHNLRALNANRMLGITTGQLSKSAEKLSSGYKVNRAADDAAGLSISEKMRKQIRGLTQASLNAEDGISSVQTAEGALNEVHDMLQRMNELANKASNGTNSVSDRQTIQDEIDQLLTEVDRVSETTKFNETYLLKGNTAGTSSEQKINAHDAGIKGKLVDKGGRQATFELEKALENGDTINIAGNDYTIGNKADTGSTEGFAVYVSDAADMGAKTLQAGDTITFATAANSPIEDYLTKTMVEKVKNESAALTASSLIEIADEQGHVTTYSIGTAAGTGANGIQIDTQTGMVNVIQQALDAGHKVTMTRSGSATAANWEIVKDLGNDEIGANVWTNTATDTVQEILTSTALTGTALTANDIRATSLGGTDTTYTTKAPMSADDFAKAVSMLKAGDQLTVQDVRAGAAAATTITIADVTDAKIGQYTTEDALKLINVEDGDMDEVEFMLQQSATAGVPVNKDAQKFLKSIGVTATIGNTSVPGNVVSVVNSPTNGEVADNVISVKEAYAKVADALQQASSIGTDEGKEASVANNGDGSFTITKGSAVVKDALKFNLHVGADADMTNKIGVTIDSMDTKGLGIQKLDVIGRDANGEKVDDGGMAATYAIDSISDAISKVSAQRSLLGAVQNRLEHTISNLDNVVENTTAAESQIRDTDMATEMVKYSNANILSQAGQSMLAQANQGNQGVLSLLG